MTYRTTRRPADSAWHTAYVYYYEKDKSGLLVDAVAPLLDRLADVTEAVFVVPHWRQGPHLRINVRAREHDWSEVIRPAIEETIGAYLEDHPSTARLDERALLLRHRRLAEAEMEPGPLTPWYPDNTMRFAPFQSRRHAVGGDQEVADLIVDFSVESNGLYLDMPRHVREGRDRLDLLMLTLLFTTAHAVGGLRRNVGSFRAHSEAFFDACERPEVWRSAFAAKYQEHRDLILDRMRGVTRTLVGGDDAPDRLPEEPVPFVREWADLITRHAERADPIIESGMAIADPSIAIAAAREHRSDYLRLALGTAGFVRRGVGNPVFQRYRVVLNYTYGFLTRMGVEPRERYLLCYLAAEAIEDVYDMSAIAFMRKFVADHPGPLVTAPARRR
ncbi:thiopeptide maturation pyridine synthase [Thermopolyspora sp. NPDC052614]|uniref:thiopeptide maturation pyridine synthase n=1 Tax=Thermopolyspora sp. NPDC052614 TaxID=3155682 RepID=UPI00342D06B7